MTIPVYAWTEAEAKILKSCWADDIGRDALTLIVDRLCAIHGSVYDDLPQRMAMYEGRRSVGLDLQRVITTPLDKLAPGPPPDRPATLTATERAARHAAGPRGRT